MKLFRKKDVSQSHAKASRSMMSGPSTAVLFAEAPLHQQIPENWNARPVKAGGGMIAFPDGSAADKFRGQWAAVGNAP